MLRIAPSIPQGQNTGELVITEKKRVTTAAVQRRRASAVCRNRLLAGHPWSLHLLDVAWLPALVDGGFGRAVEPDDGKISPAQHRWRASCLVCPQVLGGLGRYPCCRRHSAPACRATARSPLPSAASRWVDFIESLHRPLAVCLRRISDQ
jgi:hypothetical protein